MKPSKPKLFRSDVTIYTSDGEVRHEIIEVNRPVSIGGWTVYQFGYNEDLGEWGTTSIFELVRDPWLPVIYTGLFILVAGSIFMFVVGIQKKTKES